MGTSIGVVTKQRSPERFSFEKELPNPALAPADYVEVAPSWGDKILAIIESLRGQNGRYEYSCRSLLQVQRADLIGASVHCALPDSLRAAFGPSSPSSLTVGELAGLPDHIPVALHGEKLLQTHSCVFGSSGSGKSTFVGLLLEEILLKIGNTQIVILDPNSDFNGFGERRPRDDVNEARNPCEPLVTDTIDAIQHQLASIPGSYASPPQLALARFCAPALMDVLSPSYDPPAELLLSALWETLSSRGIPVTPSAIIGLLEEFGRGGPIELARDTKRIQLPHASEKATALINLESLLRRAQRPLWSTTAHDSLDVLTASPAPRLVQFDLGALPFSDRALFSEYVFRILWERNTLHKTPTFVLIDEAHNLCPSRTEYSWQQNTLDWVNRLASEGRKYGLYLIVLSQRPAKIHANTFDNCRNFMVFRLQNREDIERLARATVQVSRSLLSRVATLAPHQGLFWGDVGAPMVVRTGRRRMG